MRRTETVTNTTTDYISRTYLEGLIFSSRFSVSSLRATSGGLVSVARLFLVCLVVLSMCVGFSRPPIHSSLWILVDRSRCYSEVGIHPLRHSSQHPEMQLRTAILHIYMIHCSGLSSHLSRHALNCIVSNYVTILAPFFPLFYCT